MNDMTPIKQMSELEQARANRKKASELPRELFDLFHEYQHGYISRRAFLAQAQKFAVGGLTTAALFEMLRPNYALAIEVPPSDARIKTEVVTVQSPEGNGSIKGLVARPNNTNKAPSILVVHENRGLNPYIEDLARRLAVVGYVAFAPDGLTSVGGYPGAAGSTTTADDVESKATMLFGTVNSGKMMQDFVASAKYVKARPDSTGKLGAIGFCYGGGVVNQLAVTLGADLAAAVPFYGAQPMAADVAKIKTPISAQYGALDTRISGGWEAYDKALTEAKVPHEGFIYADAMHGFHNDTTPRYAEMAAKQAWARGLAWFDKYVKPTA